MVQATNGTANGKANTTKPAATVVNLTPPKETPAAGEEAKTNEPAKPSVILTITDRFYLMDVLQGHREKYERLKESLDKLNKFKLATDNRSDNITLKDAAGNTFATSNPEVFKKVIEWLKDDLTARMLETDALIKF